MNKTASTLLILAAALLLPACQNFRPAAETPPVAATSKKWPTSSHSITIVTGKYSGVFRLDGKPQQVVGQQDFDLKPGVHTFDVGVVARSSFSFEVLPDGNVCKITNPKAAYPDGRRLVIRTTAVTIDPGDLGKGGNACKLMAYPAARIDGRETFHLIPALVYQFDSGILAGKSAFLFEVREDGTVWGNGRSGNGWKKGSENILHLNVGWLDVKASTNTPYQVGVSGDYRESQRVPVIFGLETNFQVGGKVFRFTPDYGATSGDLNPWKFRVGGETFTVTVPWDQ